MPEFVNFCLEKFPKELRSQLNSPENDQKQQVIEFKIAIKCSIEALVRTNNIEMVFDELMVNFNGDFFWDVINTFVDKKLILKIPFRNLMTGL